MEPKTTTDKNNGDDSGVVKIPSISNGFEPLSFFTKDKSFVFAHQKIKKLVSAVYILTNFLPNEEPSKWALRKLGMELLRLNIDLKGSNSANQNYVETALREHTLEMISLLEVASFAGMVSEMNVSILKREFHALLSHIHSGVERKIKEDILLQSPFFDSAVESIQGSDSDESLKNSISDLSLNPISKPHYSPNFSVPIIKAKKVEPILSEEQSFDREESKRQSAVHKDVKLKDFSPVAVKKNKRQSIIINLLKRKKDIMVKDVSEIIHDCSEKTLQRELLDLVSQGILKKEGERRWSRYSLA